MRRYLLLCQALQRYDDTSEANPCHRPILDVAGKSLVGELLFRLRRQNKQWRSHTEKLRSKPGIQKSTLAPTKLISTLSLKCPDTIPLHEQVPDCRRVSHSYVLFVGNRNFRREVNLVRYLDFTAGVKQDKNQRKTMMKIDGCG